MHAGAAGSAAHSAFTRRRFGWAEAGRARSLVGVQPHAYCHEGESCLFACSTDKNYLDLRRYLSTLQHEREASAIFDNSCFSMHETCSNSSPIDEPVHRSELIYHAIAREDISCIDFMQ